MMHRTARRVVVVLASLVVLGTVSSCATQGDANPNLQSLDRPTDVAFGCYGRLRITDGAPATVDQPIVFTPQPLRSCKIRSLAPSNPPPPPNPPPPVWPPPDWLSDDVPPGQQDLDGQTKVSGGQSWYAFILQSVPGTVAVAQADVKKPDGGYLQGEIIVQDATPLTPGKNSLSVGNLPIAIAPDAAGCHMVTANAGSCDLSIIDIDRAISRSAEPTVRRQAVVTPSGAKVLARPAAMLAADDDRLIGRACPAEPEGLFYVAYPDCHAVAVVDAGTGEVKGSIRFAADGTASLGDGELSCPAECAGAPVTDGARPVTLDVVRDDAVGHIRLAIGLDNRPVVTVVELDEVWMPQSIVQVELTGDVGVLDVAISPQIGVGGRGPDDNAPGTDQAQFVYAVATDGSVRVAEVFAHDIECDTQADPRFLLDAADASQFTCVPVGLPGSPPRRALADGPGIRVPGDAVPVSVTIARSGLNQTGELPAVDPKLLIGTFAYIGLSSGVVAIANIDDDNYDDVQLTATDPLATQLPLAMPHQLRDSLTRIDKDHNGRGVITELCKSNNIADTAGGPHATAGPTQVVRTTGIAAEKAATLPFLRQVDCTGTDGRAPVSEVTMNAPVGVRLDTFPDWRGLQLDETWSLTWEGSLANDTSDVAIDGPAVRSGYVEVAGGGIKVHDAARPFCAIGVEDRDSIVLRGCDPSRGDTQCGPGETCYVHPDSTQASGACLPKDKLAELVGPCRDFLISARRFSVKRAFAGDLELTERRRSLRTTPITGCTSNDQCQTLATYDDQLRSAQNPVDDTTPASTRTFSCEPDPTRPLIGGVAINRCVQTCTAPGQCGAGGMCSGNYCIEAPVPPPACVVGLQRYELQASDAFVVLGSQTGYLTSMIEDPATGRCVKDPTANPLLVGRVPLTAPPCGADTVADVTPNPCTIEVAQADERPVYAPGTCTRTDTTVLVRTTTAIRLRNPGITLNVVDPTYPGDARCIDDRGGSLVGVPTTYPGYQVRFHQVAGFSTAAVTGVRASYLARLVRGPDRGIWAIDEGDISTLVLNARGAVFRFNSDPLGGGLVIR